MWAIQSARRAASPSEMRGLESGKVRTLELFSSSSFWVM